MTDDTRHSDPNGLCPRCVHARRVPHPRGLEDYLLCDRAKDDARFEKYPRQPISQCAGFEDAQSSKK